MLNVTKKSQHSYMLQMRLLCLDISYQTVIPARKKYEPAKYQQIYAFKTAIKLQNGRFEPAFIRWTLLQRVT